VVGNTQKLISSASGIREDNPEEDGWLAAPIISERVADAHNLGSEHPLDFSDRGSELALLRERSRDDHTSIISRCGDSGLARLPIFGRRLMFAIPNGPSERRHSEGS
jgi:hypothetical protein